MQKSNAPAQYVIPWANSGTKNTIPVASQIGITNGAASFTDGYPPLTFTPIASGGVPPFGADTNGILYDETLNTLWQQSGFVYAYSSTFSTNQGGYPAQALVVRSDGKGLWLNSTDNNTGNPDATGGNAGWYSVRANVGSTSIAVVNGNNTPDPSTLGPRLIICTGSISSTASLILPLTAGSSWVIYNNTSGAGSLSVQGATGTGVTVAQGTVSEVITDGTNFYTSTFNGAGVYLPINGTAVAATKLATARTIAMTGDVAWTSPAFDGTSNVTAAGTIQPGAVTLAKMDAFQANSLMGNPTGSAATPSAITLASPLTFSGTTLALSYSPVNKAGDTMTGNLSVSVSSGGAIFSLNNAASGQISAINGLSAGITLWQLLLGDSSSRTGSNAGSNFALARFSDAGALIDIPLTMSRASAQMSLTTPGANGFVISSPSTSSSGINLINTSTGGHSWSFFTAGQGGVGSAGAGSIGFYDNTVGSLRWFVNASGECTSVTNGSTQTLTIQDTGGNGANLRFNGNGATTPNKTLRAVNGVIQFLNSAYTSALWTLDDSGNTTQLGSGNFNTSDETLKSNIVRNVDAYDVHSLIPLSEFHRNWDGKQGRGHIAQDAKYVDDRFVNAYDHITESGEVEKKLSLDSVAIAREAGYWASAEVKKLQMRVSDIEKFLSQKMDY